MKDLLEGIVINGNGNGHKLMNQPTEKLLIRDAVFVRHDGNLVKVRYDDILWLKGDGNYTTLVTRTSVFSVRNILKDFESVLPEGRFMRIHKSGEDKRFKLIKPSPTRFFMTWTLQGMWVSLCAMCALTAIASSNGVVQNGLFYMGVLIFLCGFVIEMIADSQKSRFRKNPDNKDQFIRHGLWAYSRHPNYFGEITLWLGISIVSLSSLSSWQYITLISPIFTYLLLVYVSGVRILEISGKEKWGHLESYQEYIRTTPSLFPFSKLF
jgi:protein-S-isoprenylcysteine O-methyltransferase Ste14